MNRPRQILVQGLRSVGVSLGSFALWSLWLALALALAVQLYVLTTSELAVPGFVLRRIEQRLAEAGVRATFARTSFDPTGRILMQGVQLSLPEYSEPVVTADSIYLRVSPWLLTVGNFEPQEIRITGLSAAVPAMFSTSGRAEEIVRGLDATLVPSGRQIEIAQLSTRVGNIAVTARGAISIVRRGQAKPDESLAELVATKFPALCKQAINVLDQLEALEQPLLHLEFEPVDASGAMVDATLFARGLTLQSPLAAHVGGLRLATRLPLLGAPLATTKLELLADDLALPFDSSARGIRASLTGRFQSGGFRFDPSELEVSADRLESSGFSADAVSAQLDPQHLPQFGAEVAARIMGAPLSIHAVADFSQRSATLDFAGALSPSILDPLSQRLNVDVRKYFAFESLDCESGHVELGPAWKFLRLTATTRLRGIDAYHVRMNEGHAVVEFDGRHFYSPDAYARIGENFARGTYEQDLQTRAYRFVLDGRLRPMDISEWFREWWPNFFRQFEFPSGPPQASVDVRGVWRESQQSNVFVFLNAGKSVIRGAELDRVRTRLFTRPAFVDGFELLATHGDGVARGAFTFRAHPDTHEWQSLTLDLDSTMELPVAQKIMGGIGGNILSAFKSNQPPTVKLQGQFSSASAPGGAHQTMQIEARTAGELQFRQFPLEDLGFTARVRDDDIAIENLQARFAGGVTIGKAHVWGPENDRHLGFDATLKDASLGAAVATLQRFSAALHQRPPTPPGKFVQEKANVRLDLAAIGEGLLTDPFSFHGNGNATLQGAEIGEVPLFGQLSELLKFTALRFTSAQTTFKLNSTKVEFPDLKLRGANSAIDAHGEYALDRRELDFKAKIFPFQESGNLIKTVVGVVLSPISNVFEVKLAGSLEKPEWAFVIGPTNLLRSLAPSENESEKASNPTLAPDVSAPSATPEQAHLTAPGTAP
jgi:hypothetical protein